jgi:hypothetical protein
MYREREESYRDIIERIRPVIIGKELQEMLVIALS